MNAGILQKDCDAILEKALNGVRITPEEGVKLYSADLLALGDVATQIRNRLHPGNQITFVVDRNVSYTIACFIDCDFCAFYRKPGDPEAYTLTKDEIFAKIQELVDMGGTQVLIQGGVNPNLTLDFYLDLIKSVREKFPQVHLHSFSCVEMDYIARIAKIPLRDVLKLFKEAGLNSLPGAGAEILVERVRKLISPKKNSSERWIEIMRTAHEVGLRSTATMVIGHVETLQERIEHLEVLRKLQDETGGFRAFISWTMAPNGTPRMTHIEQASGEDFLKTLAIARIYLDNFENIQSGWLTEGLKLGQAALSFGANDMGGTLIEDKVLEPTGVRINTRKKDLIDLIQGAGYVPAQRNTNYEILQVFN